MSVKVDVLEGFGRQAAVRKKWLKMWDQLGERILHLPKWMQDIVLEDVHAAVRSRVATMEMIQNAKTRS